MLVAAAVGALAAGAVRCQYSIRPDRDVVQASAQRRELWTSPLPEAGELVVLRPAGAKAVHVTPRTPGACRLNPPVPELYPPGDA